MCIVLNGRTELVDILNNFLSRLSNSRGVQLAGQSVGLQRVVNNFFHTRLRNYCTAKTAVQQSHLGRSSSILRVPRISALPGRWSTYPDTISSTDSGRF